jgi:hypothetical protein
VVLSESLRSVKTPQKGADGCGIHVEERERQLLLPEGEISAERFSKIIGPGN